MIIQPMRNLLLGLGLGLEIDELSMSPLSILQIKKLIRSVSFKDAKALADKALELPTAEEIEELSSETLARLAPEFISHD